MFNLTTNNKKTNILNHRCIIELYRNIIRSNIQAAAIVVTLSIVLLCTLIIYFRHHLSFSYPNNYCTHIYVYMYKKTFCKIFHASCLLVPRIRWRISRDLYAPFKENYYFRARKRERERENETNRKQERVEYCSVKSVIKSTENPFSPECHPPLYFPLHQQVPIYIYMNVYVCDIYIYI
jgi:hypothetical protein